MWYIHYLLLQDQFLFLNKNETFYLLNVRTKAFNLNCSIEVVEN